MTFSKENFHLLKPKVNQDYVVLSSLSLEDKDYLCNKYDISLQLSSSEILLKLYLKLGKDSFKDLGNKFFFFFMIQKIKTFQYLEIILVFIIFIIQKPIKIFYYHLD